MAMRRFLASLALLAFVAGGCVTMGRDFPTDQVRSIENGRTTRQEIRSAFGEPYQTGVEDGLETWTYYRIRYRASGSARSKELHLTFDEQGVVRSHSFTSTEPIP